MLFFTSFAVYIIVLIFPTSLVSISPQGPETTVKPLSVVAPGLGTLSLGVPTTTSIVLGPFNVIFVNLGFSTAGACAFSGPSCIAVSYTHLTLTTICSV